MIKTPETIRGFGFSLTLYMRITTYISSLIQTLLSVPEFAKSSVHLHRNFIVTGSAAKRYLSTNNTQTCVLVEPRGSSRTIPPVGNSDSCQCGLPSILNRHRSNLTSSVTRPRRFLSFTYGIIVSLYGNCNTIFLLFIFIFIFAPAVHPSADDAVFHLFAHFQHFIQITLINRSFCKKDHSV